MAIEAEPITRAAANGTEAVKNFYEARAANAERKLFDAAHSEIPSLKASGSRMADSLVDGSEAFKEMMNGYGHTARAGEKMAETVTTTAETVAGNVETVANNVEMVTSEVNRVHVIGKSFVDKATFHMCFMQVVAVALLVEVLPDLSKISKELRGINNELELSNSIKVQGSGDIDGFARSVYEFVLMRIHRAR
jgi:hypothetical protein